PPTLTSRSFRRRPLSAAGTPSRRIGQRSHRQRPAASSRRPSSAPAPAGSPGRAPRAAAGRRSRRPRAPATAGRASARSRGGRTEPSPRRSGHGPRRDLLSEDDDAVVLLLPALCALIGGGLVREHVSHEQVDLLV